MNESETSAEREHESEQRMQPSLRVFSVRSEELFRGGRELQIVHGAEIYRLRVTRNNKLILQK